MGARRLIVMCAAVLAAVLAATVLPSAASAAAAKPLSPPAARAANAACQGKAVENAQTADIERVVRGIAPLGGCVTDITGIAHMFVEWTAEEGDLTGRVCVDPEIRANQWRCAWDTTTLAPGAYTMTLVAVDAAGNRGSFDQAYRVEATPDAAAPGAAAPGAADPSSGAPAQPPVAPPTDPQDEVPAPNADPQPNILPEPSVVPVPLERLLQERVAECARLELAPGVRADRSLSVAVLECLRPALETAAATDIALDEIPVPPAIRVEFTDAAALAAADQLLPDTVGGVELELVLAGAAADDGESQVTTP